MEKKLHATDVLVARQHNSLLAPRICTAFHHYPPINSFSEPARRVFICIYLTHALCNSKAFRQEPVKFLC